MEKAETMSKDQIAHEIKNIVNTQGVIFQDELAMELSKIRFLTIRESFPVLQELIANDQLKTLKEDTGKLVFYA